MNEVKVNKGYELYQIITDFGDPLEIFREAFQNAYDEGATEVFCKVYEKEKLSGKELIIDIWNNGEGLEKERVECFFDLANSSKIDDNRIPIKGKLGYKGHGSKIFFNSEKVHICSKYKDNYWAVELNNPINQIEKEGTFHYSNFVDPTDIGISLPEDWETGFFVRIIGHLHFKTQHTMFKLNHKNLRDYSKWYTVFGTVRTLFDNDLTNKRIKLFLTGLNMQNFKHEFNDFEKIDPIPKFTIVDKVEYEVLELGHTFPNERFSETNMRKYAESINSPKPYYEYYSRMILNEEVSCTNNTNFRLIVNIEGYETKRRYDVLLTKRGKPRTDITHTDSERYGIWACKGGIPVQKVDEWLEGGRGTYSFMQAFIDCDDFKLTANRGSIENSDIEKIEIVKKEINKIFSSKKLKDAIEERSEIEKMESQLTSIEEDGKQLDERFKVSKKKKEIILPNGIILKEPTKRKSGYSESETLILFVNLMAIYPKLFTFRLHDYDTTKGIDCVIEHQNAPKYIEIKGTMHKKINHPFRHIYKFLCYDIDFNDNDIIIDIEDIKTQLNVNKNDKFYSFDDNFKGKPFTSFNLVPDSAHFQSMEIISLKNILTQVIEAQIQ
jgi:hypothetical protein